MVRQQDLKYKLSNEISVNLEDNAYNVHDCANVLKTYLSELPEPLLTNLFFLINCKVPENALTAKEGESKGDEAHVDKNKQMKKLRLILLLLPVNVRNFAKDLLTCLHKATAHSNTNKMDSRNCATIFAPHLLFPKNLKAIEIQQHLMKLTDELQFMIDHVDEIFEPPNELMIDVNGELQKIAKGAKSDQEDDDVINTAVTFCNRENVPQEDITQKHLAELYAYISTMPETPRKRNLIKQFNRQNGGLTPLSITKSEPLKNKFKNLGHCIKKGLNIFPATKRAHKISDSGTQTSPLSSWNSETHLYEDSSCNISKISRISETNATSPIVQSSAKKVKTLK